MFVAPKDMPVSQDKCMLASHEHSSTYLHNYWGETLLLGPPETPPKKKTTNKIGETNGQTMGKFLGVFLEVPIVA
eukprot:1952174-Amphidinium_carterae.1